jgi:cytochrome c biogenesis protein CcmG/thiol:disulfide interchange protein DsbE
MALMKQAAFWSPYRVVLTTIVLGLLMVSGLSSCNSTPKTSESTPSVKVTPGGAPPALAALPAVVRDTELKAASGAPIRISDYSGKVLLVNLWATWCGPCRLETPELVRLYKEYQSRGVELIGLSTENPEASAETVRSFVREYKVDYRIGWATREVAVTLMQGRDSIPQSFIITRDGRILRRFIGFNAENTPVQLRQALEQALKG